MIPNPDRICWIPDAHPFIPGVVTFHLKKIPDEFNIVLRRGKMILNEFRVKPHSLSLTNPFKLIGKRPVFRVAFQAIFDRVGLDVTAQVQ